MLAPVMFDFAAGLALMALLAQSYGIVRRHIVRADLAPMILGALFGIIAFVEMHRPIEPFDGVIIDLRNIPVALAGAFLGWRGLLACLPIAIAARVEIGGAGTLSGLCGMGIAGFVGLIWARRTAGYATRNIITLLGLALAMSLHLLAALVLPHDVAVWFLSNAAGPIVAVNLVAVPAIGALMERENRRMAEENRLKAAATRCPQSGLLTAPAFVRDITSAFAAHPFGTFAGLLEISPKCNILLGLMSGSGMTARSFGIDRHILSEHLVHGAFAGQTEDGRTLVPVTRDEARHIEQVIADLSRDESGDLARGAPFNIRTLNAEDPAQFLQLVESAALCARPFSLPRMVQAELSPLRPGQRSAVRRTRLFDPAEHDALFRKAEFLIQRQHSN